MNVSNFWAVVSAEMRSCRRLIRTWVFVAIALFHGGVMWLWLCLAHTFTSYVSSSAGLIGPHYWVSNMGRTIVLWFSLGIIFLAFDVWSRDIRDRIQEAVHTRPLSNFELLTGRLLGVVFLLAIPAAVLILTMSLLGFLAEVIGFRFGAASEPISVMTFLVWDIIPNLVLWGSLTIFVSVVVRFRLLVVVIVGGLLLGYFLVSARVPFFLASALSTFSGGDAYPSALAPQFLNFDIFLNRVCMLLFAGGLLAIASVILPRQNPEGINIKVLAMGALAVAIAPVSVYGLAQLKLGELRQSDSWGVYHADYQSNSLTDIESISGKVEIYPGRTIELDLLLDISSASSQPGDAWLVSLNPGYHIKSLEFNGRVTNDFEFENGLLKLPVQDQGVSSQVRLIASGVPDPSFAYLDSSLKWLDLDYRQARGAFRFGTKSYIFHSNFVALMPGVSWFPAAGAEFGRTDTQTRPQDFYDLNIEVSVPNDWTVAGPGTRQLVEEARRTTYRFRPKSPISELALVASVFERRAMTLGGVEFELLVSKKHTSNLKDLKMVVPALKEWIGETVSEARELGVEYPYGTLSFVEVPVSMRIYGGGWKMGSVLAPPGIQMLRESGFPIARFSYPIKAQSANFEDDPESFGSYVLELLRSHFENDFEGGNPSLHLGSQFIGYQTKPEGQGAIAVDFLINELATRFFTESEGYFSLRSLMYGDTLNQIAGSTMNSGGGFGSMPTYEKLNWRGQFSRKPSVWELMIDSPLAGLDFEGNPVDAYHVLLLKIEKIVELIFEFGGEEKVGAFLSELVRRHKGESYNEESFLSAAKEVGLDIGAILGDWLHSVGLPGFVVGDAKVERLSSDESGELLYQTSFFVRNDESTPGVMRVSYVDDLAGPQEQYLETIRLDGQSSLRIAFQSTDPPTGIVLDPFLSLNRDPFRLNLPSRDDIELSDSPILPFVIDSDWKPLATNTIIVDDLDEGFSSTGVSPEGVEHISDPMIPEWVTFLFVQESTPIETDQGFPELNHALNTLSDNPFASGRWYRTTDPTSYGKYRHTHVMSFLRTEATSAKFAADIPVSGNWKLEIHIPHAVTQENYRSSFSPGPGSIVTWSTPISLSEQEIVVNGNGYEANIEFEAHSAPRGWNDLGIHALDEGKTEVVLTPKSDGASVGDAIRWSLEEE